MVDILEEYIQKLIENQNYGAVEYTEISEREL